MVILLKQQLKAVIYFDMLAEPALEALAQSAIQRTFAPGGTIFMQGEPATGMWLIGAGRVKIFKLNPDGGEHVLHILGEGNTFNDIAALDGGANPANAAALSETTVWLLPSEALVTAIAADSRLALKIIQVMAGRVRGLVQQIEDLALYSVVARLARFLLLQAEDPALSGPGVTRTAIAAHLATTPQTISNVLRTLEEAGAIEFDRHRIVITRQDILRSIAML